MQATGEASGEQVSQTRLALLVRYVPTWLALTLAPITVSSRARCDGDRVSKAWNPLRETPSAPQIHAAGQIPRCFAIEASLILGLPLSKRRLFLMSRSAFSFATSRRTRSNSNCSKFIWPCPSEAWPGSAANSITPLRSRFSCTTKSRAA